MSLTLDCYLSIAYCNGDPLNIPAIHLQLWGLGTSFFKKHIKNKLSCFEEDKMISVVSEGNFASESILDDQHIKKFEKV